MRLLFYLKIWLVKWFIYLIVIKMVEKMKKIVEMIMIVNGRFFSGRF